MDSDPGTLQPEAISDPVPALDGAISITSTAQPLDNGNGSPQADIAAQPAVVLAAQPPPPGNTAFPARIRIPTGFPPIDPDKMQELRDWLEIHAGVEGDSQVATGLHTQLLKSMEPQQQDLEAICRMMGIDTNGINWREGIQIPGVIEGKLKARPHQIAGANWISTTLESPLRAALLADECGTGKTVQIGIALAIHYYRMKAEVEAGTFKPRDEKRWFKPSVIFCLPDLAYQTFREWSRWFPDFFDIQICHGTKAQAADEFLERHIMDEDDGLQTWVDENAASHQSIDTLRNIAIIPYHTAVRRMVVPDQSQDANGGPAHLTRGLKRKRNNKDEKEELNFSINGQSYNWVICDDVYAIRGPRTKTHQLITKLDREATLGYVTLLWRRQWPFVYGRETLAYRRFDASVYFEKGAWEALQADREYKRLTINYIIQRRRREVGPLTLCDHQIREEYITYIRDKKGPLFLMNPDLFQRFCEESRSKRPGIAQDAIRPLLEMFCLRRGMLTPATMPDGTTVVPSEGMLPMHIRTVKLQFRNNEDKENLYEIIKKHYPFLFQGSTDPAKSIGHGTVDKSKFLWPNATVVRTLSLSTTNIDFYLLTQKIDEGTAQEKPAPLNSDLGRKVVMTNQPCLDRLKSFNSSGAPIDTDDHNELKTILRKDGVGGLLWHLSEMQENHDVEFPEDRDDIIKTFCSRSPKLCWAINRILELKEQGHRVLVLVDNPLTSLILMALLTSLCVKTLNIRSSHNADQRAHMVRQFNHPGSQVDALVASFQLDGFGMNLQGACHHGIVVEYPKNLPTMLHGFGRLWRMGQEHKVHWDVLYLEDSFDGWNETWMTSKFADILAAEGQIPDEIKGEYRVICGFELIKQYLGQDSNRYPRTRVTWAEQEHPLVTREGHFYSAVANYLMQNPGRFEEFRRRPLRFIALNWNPNQGELTPDMIEGHSPVLNDGVILDSRNPRTRGYVAVNEGGNIFQENEQAVEIRLNLIVDDSRLEMERKRRLGRGFINVNAYA
ncbi:hypothetical protein J7337_005061 [Fusarium musae]|uniref:Helicase C-terminal domain-containing protein n=1 Tax=Fusarium musae TaxID=1042133 RepID=A0A9P8IQU7_9HYPO|nr:hypothetical protein J7337_005061 [Fusarium musae]KAG9502235.1 hypothetical protein J7337_005061 [Fusarium musae]